MIIFVIRSLQASFHLIKIIPFRLRVKRKPRIGNCIPLDPIWTKGKWPINPSRVTVLFIQLFCFPRCPWHSEILLNSWEVGWEPSCYNNINTMWQTLCEELYKDESLNTLEKSLLLLFWVFLISPYSRWYEGDKEIWSQLHTKLATCKAGIWFQAMWLQTYLLNLYSNVNFKLPSCYTVD